VRFRPNAQRALSASNAMDCGSVQELLGRNQVSLAFK
jgi:hypothetical protein